MLFRSKTFLSLFNLININRVEISWTHGDLQEANILFKNKKPVAYVGSFASESDLEQFLNKYLPEQKSAQQPAAPAQPAQPQQQPAQTFKVGDRVMFIPTKEWFIVDSINSNKTINIKSRTTGKVFTNIDPNKLKKIGRAHV